MKLKKVIYLVVFCWLSTFSSAQNFSPDYEANYFTQTSYWDDYYRTVAQDCVAVGNYSMQGTGYSGYDRWKTYWSLYMPSSGDFTDAFDIRNQSMNQLRYEHFKSNTSGGNNGNALIVPPVSWDEIGPKNLSDISINESDSVWITPHLNNDGSVAFPGHVAKIDRLFEHPTIQGKVYACAGGQERGGGGLFVSTNYGEDWSILGTDKIPNPDVISMVIKPMGTAPSSNKEILFLTLSTGAVYRSEDYGVNWIEAGYYGLHSYPYLVDPNNPNSLPYYNDHMNIVNGKHERSGIMQFAPSNGTSGNYGRLIAPKYGRLYYADNYDAAISLSQNMNQIFNAIMWEEFPITNFENIIPNVSSNPDQREFSFTDFEYYTLNGADHYLVHVQVVERYSNGNPIGNARQYVATSDDYGQTWELLGNNVGPNAQGVEISKPNSLGQIILKHGGNIEVLSNNPNYIYIASSTVENGNEHYLSYSLWRYNISAQNWTDFSEYVTFDNRGMVTQPHGFAIDPSNEANWWFYTNAARKMENGGLTSIVQGSSGGIATANFSRIHHADARDLLILSNGDLLLGTDGGVYKSSSTNGGMEFNISSEGLNAAESYSIGVAQQPPFYVTSGFWHCGIQVLNPETGDWHQAGFFDGKRGDVLFLNNERFVATDQSEIDQYAMDFDKDLYLNVSGGRYAKGSENIDKRVYLVTPSVIQGTQTIADRLIMHTNDFVYLLGATTMFDEYFTRYKAKPIVIPNEPDKVVVSEFDGSGQRLYFYSGMEGAAPTPLLDETVDLISVYDYPNSAVRPFFKSIVFDTRQNGKYWMILKSEPLNGQDSHGRRIIEYDPVLDEFIDITFVTDDDVNGFAPMFPWWYAITDLERDRQTGVLYIGTTNGVYYLDRDNQIWRKYSTNIPMFNTDLGIVHCTGEMYVSSTNRGIWNAPLIRNEQTPTLDWEIIANTTWEERMNLFCTLIVKSGSTLTIKDELVVFGDQKIIVEPGAKLVIDGGIITTECGDMWSGIEVLGNESLTQNETNQGVIEVKNNASIEFAYNAIRVIGTDDNGYVWGTTGGIVKISEGTFRDCRRGIEFMSYQNLNASNVELNNQSYVYKAKFITDDDMPDLVYPRAAISMWNVLGIKIKNCLFENQRTDLANIDIPDRGTGIHTIDASYNVVSGYALGTGNPVPNTGNRFNNLFYGIFTTGGSAPAHVNVLDNDYNNCAYGVGLNGCNYGVIGRNKFDIPGGDNSFQDPYTNQWYNYGMGVYSQGAYGFNIEANEFNSLDPQSGLKTLSVHANNSSHVSSGKVYRNTIDNTTLGTQTVNDNSELSIDCNDITKGSLSLIDIDHETGVLADQGENSTNGIPVKNVFTGVCNNSNLAQLYNSSGNDFWYNFEGGSLSSTCHNIGSFASQQSSLNSCPVTLRNKITVPIVLHVDSLQTDLAAINADIEQAIEDLEDSIEPDLIEGLIRVLNTRRLNTIDAIVGSYLDSNWIDSAIYFLMDEGSIEATQSLVPLQMKNNVNDVALSIARIRYEANRLEGIDIDDPKVLELRGFCDFYELMVAVTSRTGSYYSMTASEIIQVENFARSGLAIAANAKSVLYFLDEKEPVYSAIDPVLSGGEKMAQEAFVNDVTSSPNFTVAPNPTSSKVVFKITGDIEGYSVIITDIKGKIVKIVKVDANAVNYEFKNIETGMYFAHLIKNGNIETTLKVMYDQQ